MFKILLDAATDLLASLFGQTIPVAAIRLVNSTISSYLESGQPLNENNRLELLATLDGSLRDLKKELGL